MNDAMPTAADLAGVYIEMREEKERIDREAKARVAEIKEQMDIVKSAMLEMVADAGANSINTPNGTIIRKIKTTVWTNNWDAFYEFMKENDAPDLLEKRIAQNNIQEFLEKHPDKLPEGLNIDRSYEIIVRAPKANT